MVTETLRSQLISRFLREAGDDLVGLWQIVNAVERQTGDGGALREQTLDVVRELLAHGLVTGDPPYSANGYRPRTDQRPDAVCAGRPARSMWCKSTPMKVQRTASAPSRALLSARAAAKRRQGSA